MKSDDDDIAESLRWSEKSDMAEFLLLHWLGLSEVVEVVDMDELRRLNPESHDEMERVDEALRLDPETDPEE